MGSFGGCYAPQVRILSVSLGLGIISLAAVSWARPDDDRYEHLALFARVVHYVETVYVAPPSPSELTYAAIRGVMQRLDRHSEFIEPSRVEALRAKADATPGDVGIEVRSKEGAVVVTGIRRGSPAMQAGLQNGDRIVEVASVEAAALGVQGVTKKLRGAPGTFVTLRVHSAGEDAPRQVTLPRQATPHRTVEARVREDRIVVIRIRRFDEGTARELRAVLQEHPRAPGCVLDLRDNPGGVFEEAVRAADVFLDKGVITTIESPRQGAQPERAHPRGARTKLPLAVLVNGRTASAAEALAAALQDNGRAVVVGTQTYGKGTIQTVIELPDGSALRLSMARFVTPRGRTIEGEGIRPDVWVGPGASWPGPDRQLSQAVKRLLYRP